jgi:hypothetical protein
MSDGSLLVASRDETIAEIDGSYSAGSDAKSALIRRSSSMDRRWVRREWIDGLNPVVKRSRQRVMRWEMSDGGGYMVRTTENEKRVGRGLRTGDRKLVPHTV